MMYKYTHTLPLFPFLFIYYPNPGPTPLHFPPLPSTSSFPHPSPRRALAGLIKLVICINFFFPFLPLYFHIQEQIGVYSFALSWLYFDYLCPSFLLFPTPFPVGEERATGGGGGGVVINCYIDTYTDHSRLRGILTYKGTISHLSIHRLSTYTTTNKFETK